MPDSENPIYSDELPLDIEPNPAGMVSPSCRFIDEDGERKILIDERVCYTYQLDDRVSEAMIWMSIYNAKHAKMVNIARSTGISLRSLERWNSTVKQGGFAALNHLPKSGRPSTVSEVDRNLAKMLIETGKTPGEITKQLGISYAQQKKIRTELDQLECHEDFDFGEEFEYETSSQCESDRSILEGNASTNNAEDERITSNLAACGGNTDPTDRSADRALARLGVLFDAEPVFTFDERIEGVGFLMFVAMLAQTRILDVFEQLYGSTLGPAFYGLRTVVMTILMMLALRIKRPENLRHNNPQILGKVLGLDRVMEVKTLRRKLASLANNGRGIELMEELGKDRLTRKTPLTEDQLNAVYIDGHVKCYYGEFKIGTTWSATKNRVVKGKTNTWINLADQTDVLYFESSFNEGMTKVLEQNLTRIEELCGEKPVLVFDRECWDIDFLKTIDEAGWKFITYRKGNYTDTPIDKFKKAETKVGNRIYQFAPLDIGEQEYNHYQTTENDDGSRSRKLIGKVKFREIRVLSDDNQHQTAIVANLEKNQASEITVCGTLFERWGNQENVFKYKIAELGLDDLWEYNRKDGLGNDSRKSEENIPAHIDHPNPKYTKLTRKISNKSAQRNKILARYGLTLDNKIGSVGELDQIPADKLAKLIAGIRSKKDIKNLTRLNDEIATLGEERKGIPQREVVAEADYKQLRRGVSHIVDSLKMVVFELETQLFSMVADYYPNHEKEGRKLIAAALSSTGTLREEPGKLIVRLDPQSTPSRTKAIDEVCRELNKLKSVYPGTDRVLEFDIARSE